MHIYRYNFNKNPSSKPSGLDRPYFSYLFFFQQIFKEQ